MLSDTQQARGLRPVRSCGRRGEPQRARRRRWRLSRRRGLQRYLRRCVRRHLRRRAPRRGGSQVFRGADLRYEIELDLAEAVFGRTVEIDVNKLVECEICHGSGAAQGQQPRAPAIPAAAAVRCASRRASSRCSRPVRTAAAAAASCAIPAITASVRAASAAARNCRSRSRAGVDTGDRVRLAGEGEAGRNGGPAGDLYVEVHVREHPIFERDGVHLSCEVPISFATAALGGSVEVPTLDGQVVLKIPAETQSGRVFRLREKGVKSVRGPARGDLFCRVVVETPVQSVARAARAAAASSRSRCDGDGTQARAAAEELLRGREAILLRQLASLSVARPPACAASRTGARSAPRGRMGHADRCALLPAVPGAAACTGARGRPSAAPRSARMPARTPGSARAACDHRRRCRRCSRRRDLAIDFSTADGGRGAPRRLRGRTACRC